MGYYGFLIILVIWIQSDAVELIAEEKFIPSEVIQAWD